MSAAYIQMYLRLLLIMEAKHYEPWSDSASSLFWVYCVCNIGYQSGRADDNCCEWQKNGLNQAYWISDNNLTHLCRMYFPILINWISPFPVLGLLGGIFHFCSNFKRNFCKQTVENLIRRRILHCLPMSHKKDARLIWVNQANSLWINNEFDIWKLKKSN